METTFETTYGYEVKCKNFFDIVGTSTEISGVELFHDGERIGSILGISVPDESDNEEVEKFKMDVENWLIDNDF